MSVPPNETGQTAKSCRCTSVVSERHSPPTSGKNGGAETAWADSPEWLRPGKTNGAPAEKNQPVRLQFLQFDHVFVVSLISTFSCTLHFPIFQNFLVTELHFFRKSGSRKALCGLDCVPGKLLCYCRIAAECCNPLLKRFKDVYRPPFQPSVTMPSRQASFRHTSGNPLASASR